MDSHRLWRRRRRRGVSEIIATVLLVAITIIAGTILWTFRVYTPPQPPTVAFDIPGGGQPAGATRPTANPSGAGPIRCPRASTTSGVRPGGTSARTSVKTNTPPPGKLLLVEHDRDRLHPGQFARFLLSDLNFTFTCNGKDAPAPYTTQNTTVLLQGTLAQMTWFPGLSGSAPAGPYLGYCGGFDMGDEAGVAFGSLFTRLGVFEPLTNATQYLVNGDLFIVYIHNGGYPLDYACIEASVRTPNPGRATGSFVPRPRVIPTGSRAPPSSTSTITTGPRRGASPTRQPARSTSLTPDNPRTSCSRSRFTT